MKFKYIIIILVAAFPLFLNAQEFDISNTAANASAELAVVSPNNNTGVLIPCMTSAQRDAITLPTSGLLIFDTDLTKFMYNAGTSGSPIWTFVGEIPKVTLTSTVTSPSAGDMRYQTTDNTIYFFNGTSWVAITEVAGP